MMKPHELALRDEQVDLRIRIALSRERQGCAHEIAAMEAQVDAIDQRLKVKL